MAQIGGPEDHSLVPSQMATLAEGDLTGADIEWDLPVNDIDTLQERGYMLPTLHGPVHDLVVYETHKTLMVVGYNLARTAYRVLLIDRTDPTRLQMTALPRTYTRTEINSRLRHEMEDGKTGMKRLARAYGIVGFMRFTESFYMVLITGRRKAGAIGGRYVFGITSTRMIRLSTSARLSADEQRYRNLFKMVDLSSDFFFSYNYDLTNALQHNMTTWSKDGGSIVVNDRFVWNKFLLKGLAMNVPDTEEGQDWILPICCGFFDQKAIRTQGGQLLRMTLLARRSNRFAGTRYLRRGVNSRGDVANEVETELILEKESLAEPPRFAALVQIRGSIPLWWRHRNIFVPKPDVEITHDDPEYKATRRHYERLFRRFGHPVVTLSLIKEQEKKPIEVIVGRAFSHAISRLNNMLARKELPDATDAEYHVAPDEGRRRPAAFVNPGRVLTVPSLALEKTPILYIKFDFLNYSPEANEGVPVMDAVEDLIAPAFPRTGFFHTKGYKDRKAGPFDGVPQRGILRTNCMDCLDRTNIAQFVHSRYALRHMLYALGIRLSREHYDAVWGVLLGMFTEHGDAMAKQYGGSQAMHRATVQESMQPGKGAEAVITGGARNAMVAIRRYYSNNVTDFEKQMGMNLFLGIFVPYRSSLPLWEMNLVPKTPAEAALSASEPLGDADQDGEGGTPLFRDAQAGAGAEGEGLASDPDAMAQLGGGVEPGSTAPESLERNIRLGSTADKVVTPVVEPREPSGSVDSSDVQLGAPAVQHDGYDPAAAGEAHQAPDQSADAFGETSWLGYAIKRTVVPLARCPTGMDDGESVNGEITMFDAIRSFTFNEPVLSGVGVPVQSGDEDADGDRGGDGASAVGRTLRSADVKRSAKAMIRARRSSPLGRGRGAAGEGAGGDSGDGGDATCPLDSRGAAAFYAHFTDPATLGDLSVGVAPNEGVSPDSAREAACGDGATGANDARVAEAMGTPTRASTGPAAAAKDAGEGEGEGEALPPSDHRREGGADEAAQPIAAVAGMARGVIGGGVKALTGTAATLGRAGKGFATSATRSFAAGGRRAGKQRPDDDTAAALTSEPGIVSLRERAGSDTAESDHEEDVVTAIGSRFKKLFGGDSGRRPPTQRPPGTAAAAAPATAPVSHAAPGPQPGRRSAAGETSVEEELRLLRQRLTELEARVVHQK